MNKIKIEYDDKGRMVYLEGFNIKLKAYDGKDNEIYSGYRHISSEFWWKFDDNNKRINITKKEYKEIEFRKKEKEYLSRTKCSRFEIMDI